jgi:hypothetical protein
MYCHELFLNSAAGTSGAETSCHTNWDSVALSSLEKGQI